YNANKVPFMNCEGHVIDNPRAFRAIAK
ncbi:hypothetical protein CP8484711_0413B, partial [Chlamydia psittaci 84-8471/1]